MVENESLSKRDLVLGIRRNLFAQIDRLVREAEDELRSVGQDSQDSFRGSE